MNRATVTALAAIAVLLILAFAGAYLAVDQAPLHRRLVPLPASREQITPASPTPEHTP